MVTTTELLKTIAGQMANHEVFSSIDVTEIWSQDSWDGGYGPLDSYTLEALRLEDVTRDGRWFRSFEGHARNLALYVDGHDNYWACAYDEPDKSYELRFVGDFGDVISEYGDQVEDKDYEDTNRGVEK